MRTLFCIFLLMFSPLELLQAQDKEDFIQNVKVSKKNLVKEQAYLLQLKSDQKITNSVNLRVLKRYSENFYIVEFLESPDLQSLNTGEFYTPHPKWKLSSHLKNSLPDKPIILSLNTTNIEAFKRNFKGNVLYEVNNFIVVGAKPDDIDVLMQNKYVTYISEYKTPKTEAPINSLDLTVNKINLAHHLFPEIRGESTKVSVKELLFDTTDIDIRNRYEFIGTEAGELDQHATLIATLIAGAGNTGNYGRGIAPKTEITSSSFLNLLPDPDELFINNNIYVQNHSYGTQPEADYGVEASAYDHQVYEIPQLVHVFSSGNSGLLTPETGTYAGVQGYSNLTGNFKMAKNILTVGAVDNNKEPVPRSSKGPAHDGRIKPELVAYAISGTSDAAAMVSGTALLLQDLFLKKEGILPPAAMIKAVLVAGAEDIGPRGIDFTTGYGNLDAAKSMKIIDAGYYQENEISPNGTESFTVNIPPGTGKFKLVIAWTDPAANPGDEIALVNDLDLVLTGPNGRIWQPWVLDSSPVKEDLEKLAVRGRDSINPVEMITLDAPASGIYTIKVIAEELTATQKYSIAYYFEPESTFTWTYPTGSDALLTGNENVIRWENTISDDEGILEYSINGSEWVVLEPSISAEAENYAWIPEKSGSAQLRFTLGSKEFKSELFAVSPAVQPRVLFNCDENLMIGWDEVEGATGYYVQNLEERYMTTLLTTREVSAVLNKQGLETPYLAVIPVFGELSGRRGTAINYTSQGVNCYFQNFFAFLGEEPGVETILNLSTQNGIAEVRFVKRDDEGLRTLTSFFPPYSHLQLSYEDLMVNPGYNFYSATIILEDGSEITTNEVKIFLPGENTFTIYPNPLRPGEPLNIVSKGDDLDFEVFDLLGRRVVIDQLLRFNDRIEINLSASGIFIVRALRNGKTVGVKKLIRL